LGTAKVRRATSSNVGTKLRAPIAFARMRERKVVGVQALPCCGEVCREATRALFEQALHHAP
jgi:hypothetical protein